MLIITDKKNRLNIKGTHKYDTWGKMVGGDRVLVRSELLVDLELFSTLHLFREN